MRAAKLGAQSWLATLAVFGAAAACGGGEPLGHVGTDGEPSRRDAEVSPDLTMRDVSQPPDLSPDLSNDRMATLCCTDDPGFPPFAQALYKRGSLAPVFDLAKPLGVTAAGSAFDPSLVGGDLTAGAAQAGTFTTVLDRMDAIEGQINAELAAQDPTIDPNGLPAPGMQPALPPLAAALVQGTDRDVARNMIFRGKPNSVAITLDATQRADKAFVTLGGDVSTPGNEVAVVDLKNGNAVQRIRVGVQPWRVRRAPGNLIFVANRYSNYISVIDPADVARTEANRALELPAEYYMEDLAITSHPTQANQLIVYATNRWHNSLFVFFVAITRDAQDVITQLGIVSRREVPNICNNPRHLAVSQPDAAAAPTLYVTCGQGGMVLRIDVEANQLQRQRLPGSGTNLPGSGASFAEDVAVVGGQVIVGTGTLNRGQFFSGDPGIPDTLVQARAKVPAPVHGDAVHPGVLTDATLRSRFEDISNDLVVFDSSLHPTNLSATDQDTAEASTSGAQRVLQGTLPAGFFKLDETTLMVAMKGSHNVQEFAVSASGLTSQEVYDLNPAETGDGLGPVEVTGDPGGQQLFTANQLSDTLTIVDRAGGGANVNIDLGYAGAGATKYPANVIEEGEVLFWATGWSNNKLKSCASCHRDETLTDGSVLPAGTVGQGGTRQNRPVQNLWNSAPYFAAGGTAGLNTNRSLAGADQLRANRDDPGQVQFAGVVEAGLICGLSLPVEQRIARGDAAQDVMNSGENGGCGDARIAANLPFNTPALIDQYVKNEVTKLGVTTVSISSDAIGNADRFALYQRRLLPNPDKQLGDRDPGGNLGLAWNAPAIAYGQALFEGVAQCSGCHAKESNFADGKNHGSGAAWSNMFAVAYGTDARVQSGFPGGVLPESFTLTASAALIGVPSDLNTTVPELDALAFYIEQSGRGAASFVDLANDAPASRIEHVRYENILALSSGSGPEKDAFNVLADFGLVQPDRLSLPGNPLGVYKVNTPSLRGVWDRQNFLRDGRAWSLRDVILAPGHPGLLQGPMDTDLHFGEREQGYAISNDGTVDVHGKTSSLSHDDVDRLMYYLNAIE